MKIFHQNDRPLVFYVDGLDATTKATLTNLIKWYGGEVSEDENCIIRFTTPEALDRVTSCRTIFFDVEYIRECIRKEKLLDLTPYKLTSNDQEYTLRQFFTFSASSNKDLEKRSKDPIHLESIDEDHGGKYLPSVKETPESQGQVSAVSSSTDSRSQDLQSVPTDSQQLQTETYTILAGGDAVSKAEQEEIEKRPCNAQYQERLDLEMEMSAAESRRRAERREVLEKHRNSESRSSPKARSGKKLIPDHRLLEELLSLEKNDDKSKKKSQDSSQLKASLPKIVKKEPSESTKPETASYWISSKNREPLSKNKKNVSFNNIDNRVKLPNPYFTANRRSKSSSEERERIIRKNEKRKVKESNQARKVKRMDETSKVKRTKKQIINEESTDTESTDLENSRHVKTKVSTLKRINRSRMKNNIPSDSDYSETEDEIDNRNSKTHSHQRKRLRRNESSEKESSANSDVELAEKNNSSFEGERARQRIRMKKKLRNNSNEQSHDPQAGPSGLQTRKEKKRRTDYPSDSDSLSFSEGDFDQTYLHIKRHGLSNNKTTERGRKWRETMKKDTQKSDQRTGTIRKPFSESERKSMIRYLIKNRAIFRAKGLVIWKKMIADNLLTNRTPQSLQTHFKKFVLTNIEERKDLTDDQLQEFLKLRN